MEVLLMTHQRSDKLSSEKRGWLLMLAACLFMTIPSLVYGQAGPIPPNPVSGHPLSFETIVTADVLARVELLRNELEVIRLEMGQPKHQRPEITVSNVAPREVVFHAFTLFRKARYLHFQVTGAGGPEPQVNVPPDVQPFHTWRIVNAAYKRVLIVKRKLGIIEPIDEIRQDDSVTPSDLFRSILQASRQFDELFAEVVAASNTVQQIMSATSYMDRLLAQFPEATAMPTMPVLERGKRPGDVYALLVKGYQRVNAIAGRSGIAMLKLEIPTPDANAADADNIRSSEVFDMAVVLVSELAYLHGQLQTTDPPAVAFDPVFKVPAHAYQQAGFLLLQLAELETRVAASPDWLTRY